MFYPKKRTIKYYCSDGTRITQTQIDRKRSEAYRKAYEFKRVVCAGCGGQAMGSAHTMPQARCKALHKTELIWDMANFWPACHTCNQIAENVSHIAIKSLLNYKSIKAYLQANDLERASKLPE